MTGAGSSAMGVPLTPLQRNGKRARCGESAHHTPTWNTASVQRVLAALPSHTHLLRAGGMERVEKRVNIRRRVVQLDGRGQSHLRIFNTHSIPGRKDFI